MKRKVFGKFETTIDKQNRIVFPAKFLRKLNEDDEDSGGNNKNTKNKNNFYLVKSPLQNCLQLIPEDVFEELHEKFIHAGFSIDELYGYEGYFDFAEDVSVDKGGRITLPKEQCNEVGIKNMVTLIGRGYFIEIWATDKARIIEKDKKAKIAINYIKIMDRINQIEAKRWEMSNK